MPQWDAKVGYFMGRSAILGVVRSAAGKELDRELVDGEDRSVDRGTVELLGDGLLVSIS
jgi:hypothetical protein